MAKRCPKCNSSDTYNFETEGFVVVNKCLTCKHEWYE